MKFIYSFLIFILFANPKIEKGFAKINVYPGFTKSNNILFLTEEGQVYANINKDSLYINNERLSFFDIDPKVLQDYFASDYIYPDYGICYLKSEKNNNDEIYFLIKNKKIFIKNKNLQFLSYKEFLTDKLIRLNEKSKLFKKRSLNSKQININSLEYNYELVLYCDDWIKIKTTDKFIQPGDESYNDLGIYEEGWTKWKDNDKILVDIFFD